MKKYFVIFISLISFWEVSFCQSIQRTGYYGDLGFGISSKYHTENIKELFSRASIDTIDYKLVKFMGNQKVKYLTHNSKIISATMEVEDGNIISFEKKEILANENIENSKLFVVFYFQSIDRKKTTYYFYRYG